MRLLLVLILGWIVVRFRRWPSIMLIIATVWHLGFLFPMSNPMTGTMFPVVDVSLVPLLMLTYIVDFVARSIRSDIRRAQK